MQQKLFPALQREFVEGTMIRIDFIVREKKTPLSSTNTGSTTALAGNKVIRMLWRDQLETGSLVVLLDGAMHGVPFLMSTPKMAKVWECLHLQMRKAFCHCSTFPHITGTVQS